MKPNNVKISITKFDEKNHQIIISAVRNQQRLQGFFDGRYRTKSETSKTLYSRKRKHKKHF
jgi:hypothetical protein